jgi:hypothetical protein
MDELAERSGPSPNYRIDIMVHHLPGLSAVDSPDDPRLVEWNTPHLDLTRFWYLLQRAFLPDSNPGRIHRRDTDRIPVGEHPAYYKKESYKPMRWRVILTVPCEQ